MVMVVLMRAEWQGRRSLSGIGMRATLQGEVMWRGVLLRSIKQRWLFSLQTADTDCYLWFSAAMEHLVRGTPSVGYTLRQWSKQNSPPSSTPTLLIWRHEMIYIFHKINSRISSISATASSFTLKHAPECALADIKKKIYIHKMYKQV